MQTFQWLFAVVFIAGNCAAMNAAKPSEWSFPVGRLEKMPDRLVVVGSLKHGQFVPSEVFVPETEPKGSPATSQPIPLESNLLPLMNTRVFGMEERASIRRGADHIDVECRAGDAPAGLVLSASGQHFPRAMKGEFLMIGRSEGQFGFALVKPGEDAPAPNQALGPVNGLLASIASPDWARSGSPDLVVTCPSQAASLRLTDVRMAPAAGDAAARPSLATWIWHAARWASTPEKLVQAAKQFEIDSIFLQFPISGGQVAEPAHIRRLVAALTASGITVHAVEGDPAMASPEGRRNALDRARLLRHFAESGVDIRAYQYDIEPYLLKEYRAQPDLAWREWSMTVTELTRVLGRKVDVVVPFWMLRDAAGRTALEATFSAISSVTIMAYRTDAQAVEQIVADWLDWGAANGIPVAIALENGLLPTEIHRTYLKAPKGQLLLDHSGAIAIARLEESGAVAGGAIAAYAFSHSIEVDSGRISFLGNSLALNAALNRLNRTLSAWPSFGGMLVHEAISSAP